MGKSSLCYGSVFSYRLAEDENFSSLEILHPSALVQPAVYFLVVTRGPQVGIFGAMEW